jgi:1,4-alpha-glucan branching enzyme
MQILAALALLALAAHLAGNVHVTRRVYASDYYDRAQKRLQASLIWLVPILGLTLAWLCLEKPQQQPWSCENLEADEVEECAPLEAAAD